MEREALVTDLSFVTKLSSMKQEWNRGFGGIFVFPDFRRFSGTGGPFVVLGGPPCQGHSLSGKRGGISDKRNHLVTRYMDFVTRIGSDGFVMENVMGLKSSAGGSFLDSIIHAAETAGYTVTVMVLDASAYGVPQRRKRVFVCGRDDGREWPTPRPWEHGKVISVQEALGDLPPIGQGEDGSDSQYTESPSSAYQQFCRGLLSPIAYAQLGL